MYLWSINFQQGYQDNWLGKEQPIQQIVLGKLDNHMQNSEGEALPHTMCKD